MTARQDVVELLLAGVSARVIAAELGVPVRRVHRIRDEVGIAPARPGPRPMSLRDALLARTEPYGDGHRLWVGARYRGVPVMRHAGRRYSARQAAFLVHTGREAVGNALPGCGVPGCVEPAHQDDALRRAELDALYAAVLGGLR